MFFIPGWIVALLTFPGVIVHEAAHLLSCRLCGVPVLDVKFLRVGNPVGYVIHERPSRFLHAFLISVGPFIINTTLCLGICFPAWVRFQAFHMPDPMSMLVLYLGISIGMHAFPSTQDAQSLWQMAVPTAKRGNPLAIVSLPVVGGIYLANVLSFFWFDYLYGVAIGLGLPALMLDRVV